MPSYVNFLHTKPQLLFTKTQGIYFDCYTFYCYNKKWLNYSMLGGNSFLLLLNNILRLFIHLEVESTFKCPNHKVHFHTNIPCQLMITNDQVYKITPKFGCTRLAYHKDLFHSKIPIDTLLLDSFFSLLVSKILLLFINFYQLLYLLHKGYLQSIQYPKAILRVFSQHIRLDIMNMQASINNTDT